MKNWKKDFPIFESEKDLHYMDTASTAQKPSVVMDAMNDFVFSSYSNVHRGVSKLNEKAEMAYNLAREKIAKFVGAKPRNIILTCGATHSINMLAHMYAKSFMKEGDEIVLSHLEHHANILPWQREAKNKNLKLRYAGLNEDGSLSMDSLYGLMGPKTKLLALNHMSNVLGHVVPDREIVERAHAAKVPVLLDGCQMVPHHKVDLLDLGVDFYAFSSHKVYGPTGIGVLYISDSYLDKMDPCYVVGGGIVAKVREHDSEFLDPPECFEAGTPPIMEAIGFGAAVDYMNSIGSDALEANEKDLASYTLEKLKEFPKLKTYGSGSVISLIHSEIHAHDLATYASEKFSVVARPGRHCCQLLMDAMKLNSTFRISFGIYNNRDDVDAVLESIRGAEKTFC